MTRSLALVLALATVAACGNDSGSSSVSKPSDYMTALNVAYCQQYAKCGIIAASAEKACEMQMKADATKYPTVYSYDDAVAKKRLSFDSSKVDACLKAIANAGCSPDQGYAAQSACDGIFKGLVPVGQPCFGASECVTGAYCDQGQFGGDGCTGSCKALVAHDAACDPQNPLCVETDFCDASTMKCATKVAKGQDCSDFSACQSTLQCRGIQFDSNGNVSAPGKCLDPGAVGDDCTAFLGGYTDCTPGLYCDSYSDMPKCSNRVGDGTECDDYSQCQDGLDCIGLKYDQNGMLMQKGKCGKNLDFNQACDPMVDETGCALFAVCDPTKKSCQPMGEGADCSGGGSCDLDLYCDDQSNTCVRLLPLGAACTPSQNPFANPCHDGSCDAMSMTCALVCE